MRFYPLVVTTLALVGVATRAFAISRADIVAGAPAFEDHAWTCGPDNLTAECADSSWDPAVTTVGPQVGLPYCWGGWVTIDEFDQQIAAGYGAGSLPVGLFLDCTTGVDCSGYVSQLWQHPHKLGTATIPEVSFEVATTEMQPGDVFNDANHHVIMFLGKDPSGDALVTESTNATACLGVCRRVRPWSAFAGYVPRAYMYADLEQAPGAGTVSDPIRIAAFPFKDWRDTSEATSDVFDAYSTAPDVDEGGPEFLYVFDAATGGTLTVSVVDGAGGDIDIHLLSGPSADACLTRDDTDITYEIPGAGTYYLVADTYVGSSGTEYTGAYWLEATYTGDVVAPQPEPGPEPVPEAGWEAGWEAGPEPAVEAGDDSAPADATPGTGGGPSGAYGGDEAEGCACGVAGPARPGYPVVLLVGVLLCFRWRRRS